MIPVSEAQKFKLAHLILRDWMARISKIFIGIPGIHELKLCLASRCILYVSRFNYLLTLEMGHESGSSSYLHAFDLILSFSVNQSTC